MTYLMSWERPKTDPLEWIQDANDLFEDNNSDELDLLDTPNFDPDEIL